MNKTKKVLKDNRYSFLSAITVAIILTIIFAVNHVQPFGESISLISDSYHQYIPLLSQLYDKLKNGESLLYSLDTGLGTSEFGNIINYMMSPFTWLIIAFGKSNITKMFFVSVVFKASLAAFAFTYFLRKKNNKNNLSLVPFGIMYALSYHFIAYYWNIMWMDAFYILPLVFYGIYKLIKEKKFSLYIIALSYGIITNYYMGYMMCIGSVIYFLYEYFSEYKLKELYIAKSDNPFKKYYFLNSGWRFAWSSILAAGISCIVLLPIINILSTTSATNNPVPNGIKFDSLFAVLSSHLFFTKTSFLTNSTNMGVVPNVYCGILTLTLVPLLFFSKKISKRKKIASASVIGIFLLSFTVNILNFFWHAFHFPNSLPYRFAYIYVFFLVAMAFEAFCHIKSMHKTTIIFSTLAMCLLSIISFSISAPNGTVLTIPISILLFIVYSILLIIFKKGKTKNAIRNVILIVLVSVELLVPYSKSLNPFDGNALYQHQSDADYMKEKISENKDNFYRADIMEHSASMPCVLYGYNGLSTFTSISYNKVSAMQMQMGVNSNGLNSAYYQLQSPIYNMMMSVDYLMNNNSQYELNKTEFTPIGTNPETGATLYHTNYPTSIAFGVQNDPTKFDIVNASPFVVQNRFAAIINGNTNPNILIPNMNIEVVAQGYDIELEKVNNGYKIHYKEQDNVPTKDIRIINTAENSGCFYSTIQNTSKFEYKVKVNNRELKRALDIYPGSTAVGNLNLNDTFTTIITPLESAPSEGTLYYYTAYYHKEDIDELYHTIQKNGIANVTNFNDSSVSFDITNTTEYIYTSIPYDTNWVIKVDGKEYADVQKTADALCAFKLRPGHHTIEFKYKLHSLTIGTIISIISLTIFIFLMLYSKRKNQNNHQIQEQVNEQTINLIPEKTARQKIIEQLKEDNL